MRNQKRKLFMPKGVIFLLQFFGEEKGLFIQILLLLWKHQRRRLKDIKLVRTYSRCFIFECGLDLLRGLLGLCRQDVNLGAPRTQTRAAFLFLSRSICSPSESRSTVPHEPPAVYMCFSEWCCWVRLSASISRTGLAADVKGRAWRGSEIIRQLLASFGRARR